MHYIKKKFVNTLCHLFANKCSQQLLQHAVTIANYFMGVGSGAHAESSGEIRVLANLASYGDPPFVIFDVGANQGQFLQITLDNVDLEMTRIHCFEPSGTAFSILSNRYYGYRNINLNNCGVGAVTGEAVLYFDKPGSGLASLTQRRLAHFGINHNQHEIVKILTLDAYCEENSIIEITLLKIDVEGHELDVLHGASKMMKKKAIRAISFEFGGCNIDTRTFLQDYWYLFQENGMKLYRVTPGGYLHLIDSYKEIMEQMLTTNFIATR